MTAIRKEPCSACPYRRDVPSGVWDEQEYVKLLPYDEPTGYQPPMGFACHATPDHFCHGWAMVGGDDLLALRLEDALRGEIEWPQPSTPLFNSHTEAAAHGMAGVEDPSPEAVAVVERLLRKYPSRFGLL